MSGDVGAVTGTADSAHVEASGDVGYVNKAGEEGGVTGADFVSK